MVDTTPSWVQNIFRKFPALNVIHTPSFPACAIDFILALSTFFEFEISQLKSALQQKETQLKAAKDDMVVKAMNSYDSLLAMKEASIESIRTSYDAMLKEKEVSIRSTEELRVAISSSN